MWTFCEASARFIFGDLLGNTTADAILRALRKVAPNGKTRTEINALFGHNRRSGDIGQALELLITAGKARCSRHQGTRAADRDLVCGIGGIQRSRTAQSKILRNKGSRLACRGPRPFIS